MIIVYTPQDGEPEQYNVRDLLSSEASIVARTIDMKWPEIREALPADDLDAMRGIVWVMKKRHEPTLRFGDFDPRIDEMVTRFDKREVEDWVDAGFAFRATNPDLDIDKVLLGLQQVEAAAADPEHARAYIEKCTAAAEAQGKDQPPAEEAPAAAPGPTTSSTSTSPRPEPSTSDSSPTS